MTIFKIMKRLTCLLLLLPAFALGVYARLGTGITAPAVESKRTLNAYLQALGLDTANTYCARQENNTALFNEVHGFSGVLLFDKRGNRIIYTNRSIGCVNPAAQLRNLAMLSDYPVDTVNNLHQLMAMLRPYTAHTDTGNYTYTAIIFWTKFLGMADNSENLVQWERILKGNKDIRIVKVNLDAQALWDVDHQSQYMAILQKIYKAALTYSK